MSCLFCKRTGTVLNIFTIYPNISRCIKDVILEIFGQNVEVYLSASDCICKVCVNVLENMAELMWRLFRIIIHEEQDNEEAGLGKIWEYFDREENSKDDGNSCRTPTPSSLLALSYSKNYNGTLEDKIANEERKKSLSRTSSALSRSDGSETSEMDNIFTKKPRKRKGHNWSRRKRHGGKSPANSELSCNTYPPRKRSRESEWDRSFSPMSDCSYTSYYTIKKKKSPSKARQVQYDEHGRLIRKRTRSVSREQEKEAEQLEQSEMMKFNCSENNCLLYFEDLDVLNQHKMMDHNILALHYCGECHKRYTTAEHLKLHKKIHDVCPFWCLMCLSEVRNQEALQKHLEEHQVYSVPCKYCDKSFLSRSQCDSHVKSAHAGRRERIIYRGSIILDRIDKGTPPELVQNNVNSMESQGGNNSSNSVQDNSNTIEDSINISNSQEDNRNVNNSPHSSIELDVTAENMRLRNIDFVTHTDSITDSSELIESEKAQKPIESRET